MTESSPRPGRAGTWNEALAAADPLLGTFLHIPSPQIVEIIGGVGFDFVVLDLEHGEFSFSELAHLQRAAELADLWSIVRVPSIDESLIGKVLDIGANAVLIPHIESAADAAAAVRGAKYPPGGGRGSFPFMRATGYRTRYEPGWEARQNSETSVILLVEGERGIGNIAEIVRVPGVTAVFVGPVDLSQALGVPGQLRHPRVEAFAHQIRTTATEAGRYAAIFCNSLDAAGDYARAGFKLIALSVDAQMIGEAYRAAREGFSAQLEK